MLKSVFTASAAVAALVALSAPSYAAGPASTNNTATVTLTGTITPTCAISVDHATLALGTLATNPATGVVNAQSKSTTENVTAYCNGASNQVDVTATPLALQGGATVPSGFANSINYNLTTPLAPGEVDTAAGGTASQAGIGAFSVSSVPLMGSVNIEAGTAPIVAGDYSGTVKITLTPS